MLTEQKADTAQPLPKWRLSLPDRPLTGMTVLVIEDSRFASEAVRLLCLRSGARIRRADCLRSAARHLRSYSPMVAIVDLGLPDGNGADLIATLTEGEPRVPVVLGMSGDPDGRDVAMDAGADSFLAKPVESLAVFQQTILQAMPRDMVRTPPRAMPTDVIHPDESGLRDDLNHVAEVLSDARDTGQIDYIARFLASVARSARDPALEEAATALARDHVAGNAVATDLARISGMVQDRLARVAGF
ncbi:response regulator [Paracoccus sp. 1_MG-2023]|uniref:response regulator n=1 Tax=unclassified Paracoccus (in: a-proteobacteria) TaxID=2688777 RepID=UPI001C08267D|nr:MULTISPECIES: response regulator [unclassified Paracoccus (in: a-proteobacteria)]MBU2958163.1 response regulator [Paracoccus sp. C2R09]MDO6668290.1 response regulator [Paracoccus sp. 1_MG-2023]